MIRFAKKFALFALIVLIVVSLSDIVLSYELRKSRSTILIPWNEFFYEDLHNDLLIVGSSRAIHHYNTHIIDSTLHVNSYNVGCEGGGVNRELLRYNTYCRLQGYPKYIIQNVDYYELRMVKGYQREQFFPYFFYDKKFREDIFDTDDFSIKEKLLPFYRYLGYTDFLSTTFTRTNDGLYKGFGTGNNPWDGTQLAKQTVIEYECDSTAMKLFENHLRDAKARNIKVIFVYGPFYIKAVEKMSDIKKMQDIYKYYSEKYDIPILDYTYSYISYDTNYFYNSGHMNQKGAELFTRQLAHDIDSLGLLK